MKFADVLKAHDSLKEHDSNGSLDLFQNVIQCN